MKKTKILIALLVILANSINIYSQTVYGSFMFGTPLWINKRGDYLKKSYSGVMARMYFKTKYSFELGPFVSYNFYEINEKKMYTSIDKNNELIEKTAAYHSAYMFGPIIKYEKLFGRRFSISYGGSLGFSFIEKNIVETTFYPKDTIAYGYSYENIGIYGDGIFSSYGYYIMPTLDFNYKIIDWKTSTEHLDVRINFGFHSYFRDGIKYNTYNTQNNNQTQPTTLRYRERLSSVGTGFHIGLAIVW